MLAHLHGHYGLVGMDLVGGGQQHSFDAGLVQTFFKIQRMMWNPPFCRERGHIFRDAAGQSDDFYVFELLQRLDVVESHGAFAGEAEFHREAPFPGVSGNYSVADRFFVL